MACKQVLEDTKIREEKVTSGYLKEFQLIESRLQEDLQADEWWDIYNRLSKWQINFDEHKDIGCLLYTSPSPRDLSTSRMPSSA